MDAHTTQRSTPILVREAENCTKSGRSCRCVWVHEAGRRPYRVPIGNAKIVYAGINAILCRDSRYILYGYDGRTIDVTGILDRYEKTLNYIVHRIDLINGEIYYNGNNVNKIGVQAVICEAIDTDTCRRASIDELYGIYRKHCKDGLSYEVLYNRYRFGFVGDDMVCAYKNTAVVCDSKRSMRVLRFMGGDVLVYNGVLLHVRMEPTQFRRIVTVYNSIGKRLQQVSVIDTEYVLFNRPPFVVNDVGLEIIKRISHMSA